jgi:hypothetical protein
VAGDADVLGIDALPVRVVGRRAGSVRLEAFAYGFAGFDRMKLIPELMVSS